MSRLELLIDLLERFYGVVPSPPRDPFAAFVWEVLSARSAPHKRDAAFSALKRIPALTPDAIWRAPLKKLEESVAIAGPYADQRLSALKTAADTFRRFPGLAGEIRGGLTAARRALKRLPQMDDGTVHRMLLFTADRPVLPVDASVKRVARRLGYDDGGADAVSAGRRARRALMAELGGDRADLRRAFVYLSHHGAATCTQTDPHCGICPLVGDCPYGRANGRLVDG